ncbi:MAG TPA: alpha-2-macroglobulin family protein [Aliidongia sp.]|nr:alpha-2-macroglobulin family protein [Aliidongia sp.]
MSRVHRPARRLGTLLLAGLLLGMALPSAESAEPPALTVRQPAGSVIVPDKFLRRWDPVTLFFDKDTGPAKGGAEDAPERYVTVSPAVPGGWSWLNARTLQFRPAEPWPALGRFAWHIGERTIELTRLLDPTLKTNPSNGAGNLDPVETITLQFAEPLDVKALAQILDIALTPLPGLDTSQTRHLTPRDFDIKTMERTGRGDKATYVVELHQPIPNGMRVTATLDLSPDKGLEGTVQRIEFTTAESFRPTLLGCNNQRVPLSAEGTIYDQTAALSCRTELAQAPAEPQPASDEDADENEAADNPDAAATGDAAPAEDNYYAEQTVDGMVITPKAKKPGPASTADKPAVGTVTPSVRPDTGAKPASSPKRELIVQFSAVLGAVDPIAARNLVRISPSVEGVEIKPVGDQLHVTAKFLTDTLYQVALEPSALTDRTGRPLQQKGRSAVWLYWPAEKNFLELSYSYGMVERQGPQMVPLRGRGFAEADVRIHAIDPRDLSFWPFPAAPVTTNDADRPPSTGEAAEPWKDTAPLSLPAQIARFGSPSVSSLMRLPLTPLGASARFGLDLAPAFAQISGKSKPGTYLVGARALDSAGSRAWMRVQVTDLSVTAIEEEKSVRFVVTSLSDGMPVDKAHVEVDGGPKYRVLASGDTAADGHFTLEVKAGSPRPNRVIVAKDDDVMVLDPSQPLERYNAQGWFQDYSWLGWIGAPQDRLDARHPAPRTLCHVFTERPIYRPDDAVHIKGYLRKLDNGLLTPTGQDASKVEVVVSGPDDAEWRYPVKVEANGSLHFLFEEKTAATGLYQARIEIGGARCAAANFKKDAYRLPRFQVRLDAPKSIPLDQPAEVDMTATYYAGGPAADRPVRWRVTQFPYAFAPKPRDGFAYATDARYQAHAGFDSTATLEREDKTDGEGRAKLPLDPTREKSNQPRRYVVEATVTGDDDKTVTNTQDVLALPAFVLALKVPRYIEQAKSIPVEALMVDGDGKPIAGRNVTIRLLQRQWSSILQASDFTDGKPKYRTEVADEKRIERSLVTGADAVKLDLPISEAGVYIVELDATDALGRHQIVSVDLFAGGGSPVTWSRPPAETFKVTPDKPAYAPGETANLVLESPFQNGRALAIVEAPDGKNKYEWVDVKNGYGKFALPINKAFMPRLPVHFALMRGRLKGDNPPGPLDLRRPETIAATAWIGVTPVKNIVKVEVSGPAQAQPGDMVDLTIKLSDDAGKPVPGEVTLWLIDQAVLALAKEAPLDPLPNFIHDRGSRTAFIDTRNLPFGLLPLDEDPGGDVGSGDQQLLNKVTIRKNFNPMPYYNPSLAVDASGTATVHVQLPDDLTIFRIRAKAVSGPDRFGFATGQIQVHLPVIVEPNLPRFVRPGDKFALAGIGRIVEGGGGSGHAELKIDGLDLDGGAKTRNFDWQPGMPQHFAFPVTVPSPGYDENGKLARNTATVTLGVQRDSDKARDAFQVDLPIKLDRDPVRRKELVDIVSGTKLDLAAIDGTARPGTVRRTLLLSTESGLVRLFAGLNYLREYPYGCTEQRVALARAELGLQQFAAAFGSDDKRAAQSVDQTLAWIATVTQSDGLVSYWPGDKGSVSLTAWTVDFMVEAKKAGFAVDATQLATLTRALRQALRSDYQNFVSGADYIERSWALAALATAGELDRGYATELARKSDQLSLEGIALVRSALQSGQAADAPVLKSLDDALWQGLVIKQRDGKEVYGGLQDGRWTTRFPQILPSETRVVAQILRATADDGADKRRLLVNALVTLGQGDGWGSTNANAEALLALTRFIKADTGVPPQQVALALPASAQQIALGGDHPVQRMVLRDGGTVSVTAASATAEHPVSVESDLTWMPTEDGSHVAPVANGFVVTRESALIDPTGAPPKRTKLDQPGTPLKLKVGDVVEDSVEIVNPADRYQVAITIPLAAGMEPLNPALNTAPPEATPSAEPTLKPSYVAFLDDEVAYFYDSLPKGTYAFHFRAKASEAGRYIQPAAKAAMMYDDAVAGKGAGAIVEIAPAP